MAAGDARGLPSAWTWFSEFVRPWIPGRKEDEIDKRMKIFYLKNKLLTYSFKSLELNQS
jgi:hypothetical protein